MCGQQKIKRFFLGKISPCCNMIGFRPSRICVLLLLGALLGTCTAQALDPSESQALLDMRAAWTVLSDSARSFPPWTTNTSQACDDGTGQPWNGLTCLNGHIQRMYVGLQFRARKDKTLSPSIRCGLNPVCGKLILQSISERT